VCADRSVLLLSLIFEAANKAIRSAWVDSINAADYSVLVSSSPTSWSNNDISLAWLEQVFDRYTKAKAQRHRRLLILDGHRSYLTMDFIDYCDRNRILLARFLPHSTHTLQPLDVVLFKLLSTAYLAELSTTLQTSQGVLAIKKGDFFPLFWRS
jgi:hypothetical protein